MEKNQMPHISLSLCTPDIAPWVEIEEAVYNLDQEKKTKLISIAPTLDPLYREGLINLIVYVFKKFPYRANKLVDLYQELKLPFDELKCITFKNLLLPIDQHQKPPDYEIYSDFSHDNIGKSLINDDVDEFIQLTASLSLQNEVFHYNTEELSYLSAAAFFGASKIFKYLMVNIEIDKDDGELAKNAIAGGELEIINILQSKDITFSECWSTALEYHRYDILNWLIDQGAVDLDGWVDTMPFSTLSNIWYYKVCLEGPMTFPLLAASEGGNGPLAVYSVDNGGEIEAESNDNTVLTFAIDYGYTEMVRALLQKGADVEFPDDDYECPLAYAIRLESKEIVDLLIEKGVNVNREGEYFESLLDRTPEMKQYHIQHGRKA